MNRSGRREWIPARRRSESKISCPKRRRGDAAPAVPVPEAPGDGPDSRLPDPRARGRHPDHVRVVGGEAFRCPPVQVDELAVFLYVGGYGIGSGASGVNPGGTFEDDIGASPAIALQVQGNMGVRPDVAGLRPVCEAIDQELPGFPQEPDRGGLRLTGWCHRGQPDDRLGPQPGRPLRRGQVFPGSGSSWGLQALAAESRP